jgi:hypothetical protein
MHRFTWDMHYDPVPGAGGGGRGGGGGATGAVPHRTYPSINSPWVPPGSYTVRLTVNGQSQTQPITIKMDPRVKITPEVQQIFTLSAQMQSNAMAAESAYKEARAMAEKAKAAGNDALAKQIDELAPAERAPRGGAPAGPGGFGAPPGPPPTPTLANIGGLMINAVMGMQGSEMAPTQSQLKACAQEQAAYASVMAKWAAIRAKK